MSSEFAPRSCARRGVVHACVAAASLAAPVLVASLSSALAQTTQQLPEVTVESKKSKPKAKTKAAPAQPQSAGSVTPSAATGASLTVPNTAEAQAQLSNVPGSVAVVPDTAYKSSTPAVTLKDVLDYVPGVFIQPKWGEDTRLSIRGSGLSRNFHLRGIQLFMDGIPINTADGYGDFQEIDPTAYRYVEVYKGANALRFGANSLGGAINFVTPTGRDANILQAQRRRRQLRLPPPAGELRRRQRPVRLLRHRLLAGAGRLPRPQLGRVDARQRQPRLPALAQRRDALLLQRQRHHAAHSGQR